MRIDELVRMEVLWTHHSRLIPDSASVRDEDQRNRIYMRGLEMLFDGNYLNMRQHRGAKARLQFLGVRVKDPPVGPHKLGPPNSDLPISREDQITELQNSRKTRHGQQWLVPCDGWIRPWAVRAVNGHTTHPDQSKNLWEIDPSKFAISPSMSLLNQLGGAFHATACRNLFSIMEKGILPGADIEDDYDRRHESGRLHSYRGIFAPWDPRKTSTKTRVAGYRNRKMPLVVLYVKEEEWQSTAPSWLAVLCLASSSRRPDSACPKKGTGDHSNSSRRFWTRSSKTKSWIFIPRRSSVNFERNELPLASWNYYATCRLDLTMQGPLRHQCLTILRTHGVTAT